MISPIAAGEIHPAFSFVVVCRRVPGDTLLAGSVPCLHERSHHPAAVVVVAGVDTGSYDDTDVTDQRQSLG